MNDNFKTAFDDLGRPVSHTSVWLATKVCRDLILCRAKTGDWRLSRNTKTTLLALVRQLNAENSAQQNKEPINENAKTAKIRARADIVAGIRSARAEHTPRGTEGPR